MRELKGLEIAARSKIECLLGTWLVPSQAGTTKYRVTIGDDPSCSCEDFQLRKLPCKHVVAARLVCERDHGGKSPEIVVDEVPKKKSGRQNWPVYNASQCSEKNRFQELLYELCSGIVEPPRSVKAGKRVSMADRVFACAFKVFSLYSGRRYMCDLADAAEKGLIARTVNPMTVMDFANEDAMTDVLYQLIERSAWPLRAIESTFAPDSSGFSTSRFVRWFSEKYGSERSGRAYVKAHIMTGVKTNIVTTCIIDSPTAADCPFFGPLLEQTIAGGFKPETVCADKGYLSKDNLELAAKHGAVPFIPFKSNSVAGEAGTLWERMFGYFQFNRADFLSRYHARSNVESTFSMVKAKFSDHVRAKTDTAMKNEVLLKFLCHNIVVVHQAILELGIDGTFWPTGDGEGGSRSVVPFCRNQMIPAGISGGGGR